MKATPKKRARQSLAFQGWWKRYGNQFACTPVPEQLRINIANTPLEPAGMRVQLEPKDALLAWTQL